MNIDYIMQDPYVHFTPAAIADFLNGTPQDRRVVDPSSAVIAIPPYVEDER